MNLSAEAMRRIDACWREVHALAALAELAALLDPDGTLGRWHVAGELSARVRRFEAVGYRRIVKGGRSPQGRLEALLTAVCRSSLPRSRERIYALLGTDARRK